MKNIKIKTKGMYCGACEMLVKDSLEDLDGVRKAEADHKSGIIEVEFDENKVSNEDIIGTITLEGYHVK